MTCTNIFDTLSFNLKALTNTAIHNISIINVVTRAPTNLSASFKILTFALSKTYFLFVKKANVTAQIHDIIFAACNSTGLDGFKNVDTHK